MFSIFSNGQKIGTGNSFNINYENKQEIDKKSFNFKTEREVSGSLSNVQINPLALGQLFGLKVIENIHMVDQVRAKTHKKKRIDKKWRKRYGYKHIPKKEVYMLNSNTVVGHPETIATLNKLK